MSADFVLRGSFAGTLAEVDRICLAIRALLAQALPSAKDRFALELLAREAFGNAVRHGCWSG